MSDLSDLRDLAPRPQPVTGPIERQRPKEPKPRKQLPKRNEKRLASRREFAFGPQSEACRKRPCCVPGCRRWPSVPHHSRSRGAGGEDRHCVPLCWEHHSEAHDGHDLGVDFEAEAEKLAAELARRTGHDCEKHAKLVEHEPTLTSRYRCTLCGYLLPEEQEWAPE